MSPFRRKVRLAESVSFGIAALDALTCGVPVGAITEMVGPECSGRTTAALSVAASLLGSGGVCAWVDVADALDPGSAAANGVDLERLLWVRCGGPAPSPSPLPSGRNVQNAPALPPPPSVASQVPHLGGGSPHPRSEGRDMPEAIGAMLQRQGRSGDRPGGQGKRSIGTPGAPNRPLSYRSGDREEQVNSDRLPPRRGDNLAIVPRCAEPQPRRTSASSGKPKPAKRSDLSRELAPMVPAQPWRSLDAALRATDLLLHNGGFSAIVLDLGSVPAEVAWRVPLATWFRFRAACEQTRASLILLTQHPCARSSAELVVRLGVGTMETQGNVMVGIHYDAATERRRFAESDPRVVSIRKPPQRERPGGWTSEAAWA